MNKISNVTKIVIVAVAAALVIILLVVYNGTSTQQNLATNNTTSSVDTANPANIPTANPTAPIPGKMTAPAVTIKKTPAPPVIHLITPVSNDIWKIGAQNVISWDKAGGISGSISLVDANTKQFMGVILPQVGPKQTSYTWNTRDLLLDRSNPLKKDVVPGTYQLKISYDGNNIQPITSPAFTITK